MKDYDASRNLSRAELDLLIAGVREMVERRAKDWAAAGSVRLQATRVSNDAARPAASRETRMEDPISNVREF